MVYNQLELIRQYCDTTGIHLSNAEKDLLCLVLERPDEYNGFISEVHKDTGSGRDYRDTWNSVTEHQYRININSTLSIDHRYRHVCDGHVQDKYWDWGNAWHVTDTRDIITILKEIEQEL